MPAAWISEIGLGLDFVAFALLSLDLLRSMNGERMARDEILQLQRAAFHARYAVLAPDAAVRDEENAAFAEGQRRRKEESDHDMHCRAVWAKLAIALALVGGGMQVYGGWPS